MAGSVQFNPAEALDKAMQLFRAQGFAGTSMHELEQAMGLGRGSIYNTFGDKQALFLACLEKYIEEQFARLSPLIRQAPRAIDGIRLTIRTAAVDTCSPEGRPGCFIGNTAVERGLHDEASAALVQQAIDRSVDIFAESLTRAADAGDFPRDRDTRVTARFLVLGVQGLYLMAKATPNPCLIRGVAEEILRALD